MATKTIAARAHLGVASRRYSDQPHKIEDARRDLAAAKIEDYIAKVVADAPPLNDEQREHLAALLRPRSGGERVA